MLNRFTTNNTMTGPFYIRSLHFRAAGLLAGITSATATINYPDDAPDSVIDLYASVTNPVDHLYFHGEGEIVPEGAVLAINLGTGTGKVVLVEYLPL